MVNRDRLEGYLGEIILRDNEKIVHRERNSYDLSGNFLNKLDTNGLDFDARQRPWYQKALQNSNISWSFYDFRAIGGKETQLGVTASLPVYRQDGSLYGVLGIDMLVCQIVVFLQGLRSTDHSTIAIITDSGKILAANGPNLLLDVNHMYTIEQLEVSNLKAAFKTFKMKRKPFFKFTDGKTYWANYTQITNIDPGDNWWVNVITPMNDLMQPAYFALLRSGITTLLILILGIILAMLFSKSLSLPIHRVATDSQEICQFNLHDIRYVFSRILEVDNMSRAFVKMRNVLYSFQRYAPVGLVKKLINSGQVAKLGGEPKTLTLMFTDIQAFTSFAEQIDKKELLNYLTDYFECITRVIDKYQGTVDKYLGDGVMAFWGAPENDQEHAANACLTAIFAVKALKKLNQRWLAEGKPAIVTRFGINTGDVIVGNVGANDHLNYTVLGDPVNLASRLEGLNKIYQTTIIVSEQTYQLVKDRFRFRMLDYVRVKGKSTGVYIYELLGVLSDPQEIALEQYNLSFAKAFADYKSGNWQQALQQFQLMHAQYPHDTILTIFIERCQQLLTNPPSIWEGIWDYHIK